MGMALAIPETSQSPMTLAMTLLMHLVTALTVATIPLVTLLAMLMETMTLAIPETSQSPMAMTPRLMTPATTTKARLRSTPPLWTNRPSPGRLLKECTSGMTTASAVTLAPHQTEQSHSLRFRLSTKNSVLRAATCQVLNAGREVL